MEMEDLRLLDLDMCSQILQPLKLSLDESLYLEKMYLEMEDLGHLARHPEMCT